MQTNTLDDRVGRLIGPERGTTIVGDTLSIKVLQAVSAGLAMEPDRKVILSDDGNFPTDLYMVEGLIKLKDAGYELRTPDPEDVMASITDEVAVVMVTEVDYCTGRKHGMKAIINKAHDVGAVIVWDLAHSVGAVPVDVAGTDTDFAIGCTYKYLNGGPGAPAFIYVAPRLMDIVEPALSGWYDVDMDDLRSRSIELDELFIREVETRCPAVTFARPRNPQERGSHISFRFENGYSCMQASIASGIIGDFRSPDIMRFGFTPLFIDETDILHARACGHSGFPRALISDSSFQKGVCNGRKAICFE